MKVTHLTPPLSKKDVNRLRAGDFVTISGKIHTARDKIYARITAGEKPPVDLHGGVIYNCGPLAKRTASGLQIISAGPTTSARMDPLQVDFIRRTGARALVGKGGIGTEIAQQLANFGCIYLASTGGAGVLSASQIDTVEGVIWEELGPEALWILRVKNFGPLIVATDILGGNLYSREK